MRLTARQLNRATLGRQLLLRREPLDAVEAVRRVVALQAQSAASPYLGLWNRVEGFEPSSLADAFAEQAIVKASLMRITLHAVHGDDYPAFHAAMLGSLRASRLHDARFRTSGLTIPEADALMPHLLASLDRPLTGAQIEEIMQARVGQGQTRAWWALRTFAPLVHAPTGGPWSFSGRSSFVAARTTLPSDRAEASVRWLVKRYLEGFGPANVQDVAQFTLLRRPVVRAALETLETFDGNVVRLVGHDGSVLFDVSGAPMPAEDVLAPPRLLPMWDSTLLAYADRSRIIPPEYRRIVIRQNGDVLASVLVDGSVAGLWRAAAGGIEVAAFHRLSAATWEGLESEARALVAFLADRDPLVYKRYGHWWDALPRAETRMLA